MGEELGGWLVALLPGREEEPVGAVLEVGGAVLEVGEAVLEVEGAVLEVEGAVLEVGAAVLEVGGAVQEVFLGCFCDFFSCSSWNVREQWPGTEGGSISGCR